MVKSVKEERLPAAEPVAMTQNISAEKVQKEIVQADTAIKAGKRSKSGFCIFVYGILGGLIGATFFCVSLYYLHGAGYWHVFSPINQELTQQRFEELAIGQEETAQKTAEALAIAGVLTNKTDQMEGQLTVLMQEIAGLKQKGTPGEEGGGVVNVDNADQKERLNIFNQQLVSLSQIVGQLENDIRQQGALLEDQNTQLRQSTQKTQTIQSALNVLNENLRDVQQTVADVSIFEKNVDTDQNMALLVAANSLKSAVERGGSFLNELQIFAAIAPEEIQLDALQAVAQVGLPNAATLSANFAYIADKIAATENSLPPDADWDDKMWHWLRGFYSRRPVGFVEGTGSAAIAARMEHAIARGDYARALQEWEHLSEQAKAISSDFMDLIKRHHDVDGLLARIMASALAHKPSQQKTEEKNMSEEAQQP